mmetsp:Transcript_67911/g.116688  ORF Transcript_67911/g.116688 Transcript_67911/m.116688 type:complete len:363 (-) Transcript_67911:200-1288(-)
MAAQFVTLPAYRTGQYQQADPTTLKLFEGNPADLDGVKSALSMGAKPMFYREGTTALHKACEANAVEAVELMVSSYVAAVEAKSSASHALADLLACRTDSNQATPLLAACGSGAVDVVRVLLKKGASPVDMENSYGSTCLHLAARSGGSSASDVCKLLLEAGALVSVPNNRGAHALHFALASKPESEAVKVIQTLAAGGVSAVNLDAQDLEGCTALHAASTMQSVELVDVLLKQGCSPATTDNKGRTALDLFEAFAFAQPAPTDKKVRALLGGKEPLPLPPAKENALRAAAGEESKDESKRSSRVKEVAGEDSSAVYSLKGSKGGGLVSGARSGGSKGATPKSKLVDGAKSPTKGSKATAKK